MARSYLETSLASTLPSFTEEWAAQRLAYPPDAPPDDAALLASLRVHLVHLLAEGRVAETTRLFYTLERLLAEADPVLRELLERDFITPLAADVRHALIDARRIEPYLGTRTRAAWQG